MVKTINTLKKICNSQLTRGWYTLSENKQLLLWEIALLLSVLEVRNLIYLGIIVIHSIHIT